MVALVTAGCGNGSGDDGGGGGSDARADATADAAVVDAAVIDATPTDATPTDAATDAPTDAPVDAATDAAIDAMDTDPTLCATPVDDGCGPSEVCGNGVDDNCNGAVDEACACSSGSVQACHRGPPGRRGVGACVDGMQTCMGTGAVPTWGPCTGGISPVPETCDHQDNNCNGCVDDDPTCTVVALACPGPGDLPDGQPFQNYVINGAGFFTGMVQSWQWDVTGGPCDQLFLTTTNPLTQSFTLAGQNTSSLTFRPSLSGDYTVHVRITAVGGMVYDCTFIVHIGGPGLRVEQCSDRTSSTDIDLHLHRPDTTTQWATLANGTTSQDDCHFRNCKSTANPAVTWGYANSPLAECVGGPEGVQWQALGFCRNPRLDIDSIDVNGRPENINVDTPQNGGTYRVMVHYWAGSGAAHPLVNVYCGGHLRGTYGQAPDVVPNFDSSGSTTGDVWRVVDATPAVVGGVTTDCTLAPLHPPGMATGYWVSNTWTY